MIENNSKMDFFCLLIVCFVLLFRERNKYLAKICKKLGKWGKFNKKNQMIKRKIRRGRRRCIICVPKLNVIITYIIPQAFVIAKYSSVIFTSNL